MGQIIINTGNVTNDGLGTPLRNAFDQVNYNFTQLFDTGPAGSNIVIADNSIQVTNTNGNLILATNGIGSIVPAANFVPDIPNVRSIGAGTNRFNTVYAQYINANTGTFAGNVYVAGNLQVTGNVVTVNYSNLSVANSNITLSTGSANAAQADGGGVLIPIANANFIYDYSANSWNSTIAITAPTFIGDGANLTNVIANIQANALLGNTFSNSINYSNLTSFGLVSALSATGNLSTSGNVYANVVSANSVTANYLAGNGGNITNITASAIIGNVPFALVANTAYVANLAALATQAINADTALFAINANLASWANTATIAQTANAATYAVQSDNANSAVVAGMAYQLAPTADLSVTGNITTGGFFIGDGSQLTGISTGANTGNVTFDNNTVIGTGDQYGGSGLYLAPGLESPGNLQYLRVRGGDNPTHIHLDTGNNQYFDQYFGADSKFVKLEANGNIVINADDYVGNGASWTFGADSNLIAPGNINFTNNAAIQINPVTGVTIYGNSIDQATALNLNDVGDAALYANANVTINSNSQDSNPQWVFDTTGKLNVPGAIRTASNSQLELTESANTAYLGTTADDSTALYLTATTAQLYANGEVSISSNVGGGNAHGWAFDVDGNTNIPGDIISFGNIGITTNVGNTTSSWTFDNTGNLNTPGGMIINGNINTLGTQTALLQAANDLPLSFIASGANGSVTSFWAEDFANLMTSNIAAIYTPLQNTQTVRIVTGSNGGNIAIYDFDNEGMFTATAVCATGNVTVGGNLSVTGNITSTPVGFRATTPVTNLTVNNGASATMIFGTEEVDTKNCYDPATGRFTPNAAGYYSIDWFIVTSANGASEMLATLAKNGTDIAWGTNVVNATAHWNGVGGSAGMIYLNGTTDYINVKLTNNSGSTATVYSGSLSYFSAYLIR